MKNISTKAALLVMVLCLSGSAMAQQDASEQAVNAGKGKTTLEMVFVLDTTGSMGGLIDGAKQKIWSIVNDVLKSKSRPTVKVGLVAYRDHGDDYVTKVLPITSDLDKVYSTLMEYQAGGGGDGPEDVRQALADGVSKAGWSRRGSGTAQILFLVGDAPPHDDYNQEPSCQETTTKAVGRGIFVNTIQCGGMSGTREIWTEIARRGEGQFFAIAQDGGVRAVATPYDSKLSALGSKIGSTYLAYGGGGGAGGMGGGAFRAAKQSGQAAIEERVAARAPLGAQADRAVNKALNSNAYSDDLLQGIENGAVKLDAIKKEELPDDLQKLSPDERRKEVDRRLAERKRLRAEILDLSKKRDTFLADVAKKQTGQKQTGFDKAVGDALKKQAAKKGIRW